MITKLNDAGFIAYMAGGCVRDALLNRQPKDFDVATNATPESVREVFGRSRTLAFGASFGVIGVLPARGKRLPDSAKIEPIEVATFRSDGEYSDGRRPDSVHYGDPEQDALRRDFTINGLFYDPQSDQIVDYVGGQADLKAERLCTIGAAEERFGEDKLRMLRAVRFATTLGFRIDDATRKAIVEHSEDIGVVSGERIGAEMRRVLTDQHAADGLAHLIDCRLQGCVLPESEYLDLGGFRSLSKHAVPRSFPLALSCLLKSLDCQNVGERLSAITKRWKLSNDEVRIARSTLEHHATIIAADQLTWSKVQPVLMNRDSEYILRMANAVDQTEGGSSAGIQIATEALNWPAEKLNPPALVTGEDLKAFGIPTGPHYRSILQTLRDQQLDGEVNTPEEAFTLAQKLSP
ncbi:MAG: CCA tRNA nucleotidyltransferase [Rubripirellula sp.]